MAKVVRVKDIREQAKHTSLQAVQGASAFSVLNSARSLADAGFVLEDAADLKSALFKYSQAASLLEYVLNMPEYKRETPKGQRGALYHQTTKLSEYITHQMLPRAKKIEESLREIEANAARSPVSPTSPTAPLSPSAEPEARSIGSIADRMRMLSQAGLNVGSTDKPKSGPPPSRTKPPPAPVHVPPLESSHGALDAGLNPLPLNAGGGGGGASTIQHDLAFLTNIASGRSINGDTNDGNNRSVPPTNGHPTHFSPSSAPPPTFTPSQPSHQVVSPPQTQSHGMFSSALSSTSSPVGVGMFGLSPTPSSATHSSAPSLEPSQDFKLVQSPAQPRPAPISTSQPPPLVSQNRSPRSMSLSFPSPGADSIQSPTKSPRPPIPPRLTPASTGERSPISSRPGMGTPRLSRNTFQTSPQTTGAGDHTFTNGTSTPSTNGVVPNMTGGTTSGSRTHPVSPLATGTVTWSESSMPLGSAETVLRDDVGPGPGLGLGLGLGDLGSPSSFSGLGITHSPQMHNISELAEEGHTAAQNESQIQPQPSSSHRRSNTVENFAAAFPSLDELEAKFSSADDAESRLMSANVPTSAPGANLPSPPPSAPPIGFEFGQKPNRNGVVGNQAVSPVPRPFPNIGPDLDSTPRPASTPATNMNGVRPGVAFGSAKGAQHSTTNSPGIEHNHHRDTSTSTNGTLKPLLPMTNVVTTRELKAYLATALTILVFDVRPREQYNARRMPVEDSVCIEPIVLGRKGMSAKELQEALILSPNAERTLFERRNIFDLVVLVDEDSEKFGDLNTPIGMLFRMIYENEFLKPLRRSPMFLRGGIKAWANDVGELVGTQAKEDVIVAQAAEASKRLSRKPAVSSRTPAGSMSQHARAPQDAGFSGSSFGTHAAVPRTPITYPERAVSPPVSTGTPTHSHRRIEDIMSPPHPSGAGYFETPHHAYSGSVALSTTRPPSIDYPNLIRPPPAAASPVMERVDNRPRTTQPPKPPKFSPNYDVVYWREELLGMSGLRNLGNNCYMNSTLQCLSASVPFARFFTDGRWQREVNMLNPLGTKGELANAFYHLLRDMWQAEMPYLTPIGFKKSICQHARQFMGTEQHDAQEFLIFLLDGIHEDLNRIFIKPTFEELTPEREAELERMPRQLAGAHEWARYKKRNDSIVVDYFQGQFCNQMQCLTCGETSTTYNAFLNLSVPIPAGKGVSKVSLAQCINALVNKEVMDNADAWHCPRCKKPRKAAKQLTMSRMPPVLIIQLKRFSFKGPFTDKLETLVEFPLQDLDFTNYMPSPLPPGRDRDELSSLESYSAQTDPRCQMPQYKYELYGVTNHFGNLGSGHYTAFVKSRGKWLYCDDSRIVTADPKDIVGKPAYILFYKRVPPGQ